MERIYTKEEKQIIALLKLIMETDFAKTLKFFEPLNNMKKPSPEEIMKLAAERKRT